MVIKKVCVLVGPLADWVRKVRLDRLHRLQTSHVEKISNLKASMKAARRRLSNKAAVLVRSFACVSQSPLVLILV